jgi:hypothetical protein
MTRLFLFAADVEAAKTQTLNLMEDTWQNFHVFSGL